MGLFPAAATRKRPTVTGSTVDALVANYTSRVAAAGRTISSAGSAVVREVFEAAADNSVTVNSGWLGGSACNVAKNNLLNLVAGKSSLTGNALHADSVQCEGMLTLRITGAGQGLVTNGESLFSGDGSQPYSVLFLMNSIGDPKDEPPAYYEANPITFYQGGGRVRCATYQAIIDADSQFFNNGATAGGNNTTRENQMDMHFVWVHFANGNWCAYHASTTNGNPIPLASALTGRFEWCNTTNQLPASVSLVGAIRFDGALTGSQRTNIFNRIWRKCTSIVKTCLIVGNSVTITGVSDARVSWPRLTSRWGLYNNMLCLRRAQGACRLPKFAPVGYALPPGSLTDPDIATMSIDLVEWFRANVFVNDDQQNMVGGGQPWATWLHCHNSFPAKLQTLVDVPVRAVMGTQMAHIPLNFGGDYSPLAYPGFGNSNWRQVTLATRSATQVDFLNVPTTIADVWTAFNLGNTVSFGGLPSNPATDFANGNPDLFADRYSGSTYLGKDAQHPNNAGHAVMFNLYRDAIERALAL